MNITFNPVSFKGNNLGAITNPVQAERYPQMDALALDNEHAAKSKSKVELFNYRLHDDNWSKTYDNATNTVHIKFPNSHDGTEYDISSDGKVIESDGWSSPRVILDKHEELGKYVLAMKDYQIKSAVTFGNNTGSAFEDFTIPRGQSPKTEPVKTEVSEAIETPVAEDIKETAVENKLDAVDADAVESAVDNQPKRKTTFKEKIANVWKFFASLGQMTKAVGKGIMYGVATAGTLLAGSWLFNTLPKAFSKEGPKLAQVFKHPITHIAKSGKVIAGIGAAAVFAYHLIAGRLTANQRTADIDHKLHVGHRDV